MMSVRQLKLRPVLASFAQSMERELRANDYKGGWDDDSIHDMLARLCEETAELIRSMKVEKKQRLSFEIAAHHLDCASSSLQAFGPFAEVRGTKHTGPEAADVANFAMMIADLCAPQPPHTPNGG